MKDFLGVGTVVLLKGAEHELMIIGFFPQVDVNGEKKIFDYLACHFPEGLVDSERTVAFNKEDIEKVTYESYSDDDNKLFLKKLSEIEEQVKKGG